MCRDRWMISYFVACLLCIVTRVDAQFRVADQVFPIESRMFDGVFVKYTNGLVVITTNLNVKIEEVEPLIKQFSGEILRFWELDRLKEFRDISKNSFGPGCF